MRRLLAAVNDEASNDNEEDVPGDWTVLCSNLLNLYNIDNRKRCTLHCGCNFWKEVKVSLANAFFTRIGQLLSLVARLANIVDHRRASIHRSVKLSRHRNDGLSSCEEASDPFRHCCCVTNNLCLIAIYRPKQQQSLSLTAIHSLAD